MINRGLAPIYLDKKTGPFMPSRFFYEKRFVLLTFAEGVFTTFPGYAET